MPSSIDSNLKAVVDQFTPDILGVFWITNEELSRKLLGFDEFNYLFDGLISQYLYDQSLAPSEKHLERSNVFFTKNFGQQLFLAHLKMHTDVEKVIGDQISVIEKNKNGDRKKILIFNQTEKNWLSSLQLSYPQFEFHNLESIK